MKHLYSILLIVATSILTSYGQITHIKGPEGSGRFGQNIVCFENGNYAVADPIYSEGGLPNVGAVYIYNGKTHQIIASLKGTSANDHVGITTMSVSGSYLLVHSPYWGERKGAITILNSEINSHIRVNSENSLIGTQPLDLNSFSMMSLTSNLKIILCLPNWDSNKGAVLVQSLNDPLFGSVSSSNAFVGANRMDQVGSQGVIVIGQKIIINSPNVNNQCGAVTVLNLNNCKGELSTSNSLVGDSAPMLFTTTTITLLKNRNSIVVSSPQWNHYRGAVTHIDLDNPTVGYVTAENSLVGSNPEDQVGASGVYALENGNYVIASHRFNETRGAATWVDGSKGIIGYITEHISLVGVEPGNGIGSRIYPLPNGHFVIASPGWHNTRGAVTWVDGNTGVTGIITSDNSLIGTKTGDRLGYRVEILQNSDYAVFSTEPLTNTTNITCGNGSKALTGTPTLENSLTGIASIGLGNLIWTNLVNGNAVFSNYDWNNSRGAVTFIKAGNYPTGPISAENSIVGENEYERVGSGGVIALTNGNYVFSSPTWSSNKGAITWGNGVEGTKGPISAQNSLVGIATALNTSSLYALTNGNYVVHTDPTRQDQDEKVIWGDGNKGTFGEAENVSALMGNDHRITAIIPLKNGHYVVNSNHKTSYNNALTWMNGTQPATGRVSAENSLMSGENEIGFGGTNSPVTLLNNNDFIVYSSYFNKSRGSVTWVDGNKGLSGLINETNSILGTSVNDGRSMLPVYNYPLNYLMVGRPEANTVSIFNPYPEVITRIEKILSPKAKYTTLYPNPSTSYSTLKTNREQIEQVAVKLINSVGQTILFQTGAISKDKSLELAIQHLAPGNYIIEVHGSDYQETHKLIKQ